MTDPTRDALSAAVLAHPDEDTPRLVFADYLDEHGDGARAGFVRVQCALARMNDWDEGFTALDVRCRRLLAEHPGWLDPVRELHPDLLGAEGSLETHTGRGPHSVFRRGFAGVVAARAEWFAATHAELFSRFPIEGVGVNLDYAAARDALADCPALARLCGLGVSLWDQEREGLAALAHLKHVERVRHLELYSEAVVADSFKLLLAAAQFAGLEAFRLWSDCRTHDELQPKDVVRDLDRGSWFFGLRDLTLDGDVFEGLGQRLAREANWEPRLRRLSLRSYMGRFGEISPEVVARVAVGLRSGWFAGVRDLDLGRCDFEGLVTDAFAERGVRPVRLALPRRNRDGYQKGMEAQPGLLATDWLSEVRALHLHRPGSAEINELAASNLPGQLRVLVLEHGSLSGGNLNSLLDVPGGWPCLERLDVAQNPVPGCTLIPDGALRQLLVRGDRFPRLVSLAVGCGEPAPKFLAHLADAPLVAQLRELALNVFLGPREADALARSNHLAGLDLFSVNVGRTDNTSLELLKRRFGPRLTLAPPTR